MLVANSIIANATLGSGAASATQIFHEAQCWNDSGSCCRCDLAEVWEALNRR